MLGYLPNCNLCDVYTCLWSTKMS